MTIETGTILDQIIATTRSDLETRQSLAPRSALEQRVEQRPFFLSLDDALRGPGLSVIAEVKRGSPSKGMFPVSFSVEDVVRDYVAGGARAVSVLTDAPYFHGSLEDLETAAIIAHGQATVPVLRKDFMVDPYQIVEAAAHGADAILLIVAALEQGELEELHQIATEIGLSPLVEVHDEIELERALEAGATVVGVNNRDLHTFYVDLHVSERIAATADDDVILVGESGIQGPDDAQRMFDAGMDAILVGESLIVADDRQDAVLALASIGK